MLRIFFWKIGFEWANLRRAVFPAKNRKVYYFAFGANLSKEVLKRRKIEVFETFDHQLDGACLQFTQTGFYKGHGYASADPEPGNVTYGKMYSILESDARRMDYYEGVPFLDVHEKVTCDERDFSFYYYRAMKPEDDLKPTQEYLDYITSAYRDMPMVPRDYLESLKRNPVLEEMLPRDSTGDFVRNIHGWPAFLHPLLVRYESICHSVVEFFWNRSLVAWMIK